ncbi:hypothetical protein ACVWWO_007005 [Bradyrhizobium sp. F1.13.1]
MHVVFAPTRRRLPSRSYASRKAFIVQTPSGQVCSLKREETPWITSRRARPTSGSRLTQSKYCYQKEGEPPHESRADRPVFAMLSRCPETNLLRNDQPPDGKEPREPISRAGDSPVLRSSAPPLPRASVSRRSLPAVEPRDLSRLGSQGQAEISSSSAETRDLPIFLGAGYYIRLIQANARRSRRCRGRRRAGGVLCDREIQGPALSAAAVAWKSSILRIRKP